ncbi:MAG: GNAT family N-acetyltransferase [Clostridia bacterium]|nr:GNAT family N-acetyltransferase [Clostridia bacterium]
MELKEQALALYKEVFWEDGADFATAFTDKYFERCCKYVLINGEIVSMLYLLDCTVFDGENTFLAKYLYAAATKVEHRKKGLMSKLINSALMENKIIITKPATEELFAFYEKFGFTVCSYKDDVKKEFHNKIERKEYIKIRKSLLLNTPHIILADEEFALCGLALYGNDAYCAAVDNDTKLVKEYISKNSQKGTKPFAMWTLKDKPPVYFGVAMD